MNWIPIITRNFGILLTVAACVTFTTGQTPLPNSLAESNQQQVQKLIEQRSPSPQQMPDHLVGVEAGKSVKWTMKDAILAALEKNPDIEIGRQNVRLAQYDFTAAKGVYDPIATSALSFNAQKSPNISLLTSSIPNFSTDTLTYNFGITKPLEGTGSTLQLSFNNARNVSNSSSLATSYTPSFLVTWTQPLMRNFKIDVNRQQIQIAKKKLDLSDEQFRQQTIQIIANVQQAYWGRAGRSQ